MPPLPHYTRNFSGAIRLAHWLKEHHFGISTTLAANISPGFVDAVAKQTGHTINWWDDIEELKSTSVCLRRGKTHAILLPKSYNHCHQRYALCKELCHVLTDTPRLAALGPSQQLKLALACSDDFRSHSARLFFGELDSEDFCMMLAIEMMLPQTKRDEMIQRMKIGESTYDVALRIRVPEVIVKFFKDSPYHLVWPAFKNW